MVNIGILGGTFDPIHLGHTEPAKVVADYLSLDKVLLIPASIPPHKAAPNVSAQQRADMVALACAEADNFYCDQRELARTGNSYTIDTLKALKQNYPEQRLFFIIGLDSLLTFTQWHKYQEILSLCHLVVNSRPNYQITSFNKDTELLLTNHQVNSLSSLAKKDSGGIIIVPNSMEDIAVNTKSMTIANIEQKLNLNISSTDIRARLANNQSCNHLLADSVLAFINKNQLYR